MRDSSKIVIHIICLLLLSLSPLNSFATIRLYNQTNDFGSLAQSRHCLLSNGTLTDWNTTDTPIVNIDTADCSNSSFKFHIRLANLNNIENKKYYYFNSISQKKEYVKDTSWGAVWNYIDNNNYYAIKLHCQNSNYYDLLDKRSIAIEIIRISDGTPSVLFSTIIDHDINLKTGYNTISICYDGVSTSISIGDKHLQKIAKFDNIIYHEKCGFGYIAYPASKIGCERASIQVEPNIANTLKTEWSVDKIQHYLATSLDPIEGFWSYLDRDLDESRLKLGGRYTIALISNGKSGYDIIYIDGAKVNKSCWTTGMLKGSLRKTRFIDSYDLTWTDAMMQNFTKDIDATIENGSILSLNFPLQKSKMRFVKKE